MVNNKINGGGYFDFKWMFKPSENNGSSSTQVNDEEKKPYFSLPKWLSWGAKPTDQPDQRGEKVQQLAQPTQIGGSKRKTKKAKKSKKSKTSKAKK